MGTQYDLYNQVNRTPSPIINAYAEGIGKTATAVGQGLTKVNDTLKGAGIADFTKPVYNPQSALPAALTPVDPKVGEKIAGVVDSGGGGNQDSGLGLNVTPADYTAMNGEAGINKIAPYAASGSMPWVGGSGTTGITAEPGFTQKGLEAAAGLSGSPYGEAFTRGQDAMNAAVAEFKDAKDFDSQFAAKVKINALGAQLKELAGMNSALGVAGIGANTAAAKLAQEGSQFQQTHALASKGLDLKGMYEMGLLGNANRALDIKEATEGDKSESKLLQLAALYGTDTDRFGNKTVNLEKAAQAHGALKATINSETGAGLTPPKTQIPDTRENAEKTLRRKFPKLTDAQVQKELGKNTYVGE